MLSRFSSVQLSVTPWTVAHQALLSMGFFRREYWSGLPFPSPEEFPDPGIKPESPALQEDSSPTELLGKPHCIYTLMYNHILLYTILHIL